LIDGIWYLVLGNRYLVLGILKELWTQIFAD